MKKMNDFIELAYNGGLMLEKVSVRKSAVSSVQKPKNGHGCIVQVMAEKFPVAESYEEVLGKLSSSKMLCS